MNFKAESAFKHFKLNKIQFLQLSICNVCQETNFMWKRTSIKRNSDKKKLLSSILPFLENYSRQKSFPKPHKLIWNSSSTSQVQKIR